MAGFETPDDPGDAPVRTLALAWERSKRTEKVVPETTCNGHYQFWGGGSR